MNETKAENKALNKVKIQRGQNDWIIYWVEEKAFHAACGPLNMSEAVKIFIDWFDS